MIRFIPEKFQGVIFLVRRLLWLLVSVISFLLLVVGIVFPIVPQVPFLLAFLYSLSKFSPRFHKWLLNTRVYRWLKGFMNKEKEKIGMKRLSKSKVKLLKKRSETASFLFALDAACSACTAKSKKRPA